MKKVYSAPVVEEFRKHESGLLVSNLGRIYVPSGGTNPAHFTFGSKNSRGYLYVSYNKKRYGVHQLVVQVFLENPHNYNMVNHKDENPLNNCVENLEWCDCKYNTNYGTARERARIKLKNANIEPKPVLQYSLDGEFIREWPTAAEAGRNGYSAKQVGRCCRGRNKTHKGYKWEFKNQQPAQFLEDNVPVSAFYEYDCDNNHFDLFQYSNLLYDEENDLYYNANQ